MDEKIIIFDTTLRDGEQSPGASLGKIEKLQVARQLEKLGVDVIEAGFPVSSPGEFEAVKLVAQNIKRPIICALARCIKNDIDRAINAVKFARHPRVHVFLATSKIHMKYKLKKAEDEILRLAVWGVSYARKKTADVEFSPEDATRTEKEFLFKVVEKAIAAGATTINIPDTVGYAEPYEYGQLIKEIIENVPNINKAVLSVHCHNDLGLAVANSLSAVKNGARQVECTINGIGERAGSASLEEIVMALKTRDDLFNKKTGIDTKEILKTSRLVSKLTGIIVQPNKAIVGQNAFSHESGIHQDGILKWRATYEIIEPKDVGFGASQLVLGKHSGRHAFIERLKALGFVLKTDEIEKAFKIFKVVADKKKVVYDDDLAAIVEDEIRIVPQVYSLESLAITSGTKTTPTATIKLKYKNKLYQGASTGDGPVDACYKAIERIIKIKAELLDYSLKAVTKGKDAIGEVTAQVRIKGEIISGRGASTDVIEASAKAYLNAINKSLVKK